MKGGEGGGGPNTELYALLNISPEASDEEIRKAYRQWAQVYHPDKYQAPQVLLLAFFLNCYFNFNSVIADKFSPGIFVIDL